MGGESSKDLTPRQLDDLRRQTPFTQKEIKEWFRKFSEDCPSGHMTQQEFQTMYEHLFPKGDSKEFSEIVFKAYDKDGNGQIDFQEFVCTVGIASRGSIDEKLRWAFNLYDIDNNGFVTKAEISAIFTVSWQHNFLLCHLQLTLDLLLRLSRFHLMSVYIYL